MAPQRTLIQFDPDKHASTFDAMVAIDSGVEKLLQYDRVAPEDVRHLIYGAIFTRGVPDLKHTAVFVGGTNVLQGEALLKEVANTFFGPMRVSVLMDSNGSNTTASAAVLCAKKHIDLAKATALVLAGTGPVGQRIARLLCGEGANVLLASRQISKANAVCDELKENTTNGQLTPIAPGNDAELSESLHQTDVVFSAGTTGVQLLSAKHWRQSKSLRVMVDLNAVPPLGIEDVGVQDCGAEYDGTFAYGAIGVGGTKMKIHKAAIKRLFTDNSLVLDAEQVYQIGIELE